MPDFFNCHFWDTVIFAPFTDQLVIGGDVLIVAGSANFLACTFTSSAAFVNIGGAGFNVAVIGGVASFVGVSMQMWGGVVGNYGLGTNFFVGGRPAENELSDLAGRHHAQCQAHHSSRPGGRTPVSCAI
jgi:hypothetical protein